MAGQNLIQKQLSGPDAIGRVRQMLAEDPDAHRTAVADRVCDEFGFRDACARRQRSGCLKALRVLESRGCFALPPPRTKPGPSNPRRFESPVPAPRDVPDRVDLLLGLELVLVESEEHVRIWNTMLLEEHPRGAGPLMGRQLRYLLHSQHGWLGAVGFASAALNLHARDQWIGWDTQTRQAHLDMIVGMARFLIRPSVRCQNLASRVLALVLARMPQDFHGRYGYQPWLVETFVDTSRFSGGCYRAANWIRVGSTRGRGRQDRLRASGESVKDVYVYVLEQGFRARLGLARQMGLGPLPVDAALESSSWAELEFGGAPLGDVRLSARLVQSAVTMAENPMLSFASAAGGDKALVKGYYRLIDQPDDSAVTMESILLPHRQQTIRRMKSEKVVLCIQDGTDLDYNGASECQGLGVIGTNQTGAKSRGLHLHSNLVVTDEGLPLGVLQAQCCAPTGRSEDETRSAREIPIEQKENYSWLVGMRDCEAVAAEMPGTRVIQVMDRAADFFELFDAWREGSKATHLLIRAKYNRATTKSLKLFDSVRATEPRQQLQLTVDRQSARPKKSKQAARPKRDARVAELTLRYEQVELPPTRSHGGDNKEPIQLCIVHLLEEVPPEGVKALEWFLLTTMEVADPAQALRLVGWYCLRWRIEDWHRVLKSGCRVEDLRNETADRLKRALAIYLVIAWRIMLMTLLGREGPDLPPDVLFSDVELKVLSAFARSRRDLKPPVTLNDAVALVGRIGGHLARKGDPPPGHQALWIGYSQLRFMCAGYLLDRAEAPSPT